MDRIETRGYFAIGAERFKRYVILKEIYQFISFKIPAENGVHYARQLQKRTDKQRHLCFFFGIYLIIGVDLEIIALWW